jgi:membrane protein
LNAESEGAMAYLRSLPALMRRSERAELGLIAAGVAFFGFLAIFPAVAVIIAVWGFVADPIVIRQEVLLLQDFLPTEAYVLVVAQVDGLLSANNRALGWSTVFSTVLAFWAARAGMAALIQGLNAVHHLPQRTNVWHQVQALVMTVALVGLALGAMLASVVGPLVIGLLPLGRFAAITLELANFALGAALLVLAIGLAYRFGPNRTLAHPLFTRGLLLAIVLWALASRGFVIYLANFNTYNQIYGSIGAVAALLMWLYLSVYAVLIGAAYDAERSAQANQ